jgi:hypothetical protein
MAITVEAGKHKLVLVAFLELQVQDGPETVGAVVNSAFRGFLIDQIQVAFAQLFGAPGVCADAGTIIA